MGETTSPLYALVLAGGGARGAYEAGVLHYLRTQLPPKVAKRRFQIYCGSSVGGINISFLAALADYPRIQGEELRHVWENLRQEDIYRRDLMALGRFSLNSVSGAVSNLLRRSSKPAMSPHFTGFFDTSPFPAFLRRIIPWQHLHRVVRDGLVGAVSLTATNLHNGKMELFVDHHPSIVYSGNYTARMGPLQWYHAMASAAIPIMFSPVRIGGIYYSDGGVRANTPMSPAIHLGGDRLLVVGMHSEKEVADDPSQHADTGTYPQPALGEVAGTLLRAMFVDRLDYDLKQLRRINQIVEWGCQAFGDNFLEKLNRIPKREQLKGDIATRGVKNINAMTVFPSRSIPEVLSESLRSSKKFAKQMTTFEKVVFKVMDIDPYRSNEFLSYFLFAHDYLVALTRLGFDDANSNRESLIEFLSVE